jgi:transcriptional regulator with XRE-family HTH domain
MNKEHTLSDFSKNLKAEREKKGISQQKLADLIGTQKSMIQKYEKIGVNNEKGFPNALTAKRLADALNITLNDLFNNNTSLIVYSLFKY